MSRQRTIPEPFSTKMDKAVEAGDRYAIYDLMINGYELRPSHVILSIQHGHDDIAIEIIDHVGYDEYYANSAASYGRADLIEYLFRSGYLNNKTLDSLFRIACINGRPGVVDYITSLGVIRESIEDILHRTYYEWHLSGKPDRYLQVFVSLVNNGYPTNDFPKDLIDAIQIEQLNMKFLQM